MKATSGSHYERGQAMDQYILKNVVVDANGCWIWQKSLWPDGYGVTKPYEGTRRANKAAYLVFKGDIPDGLLVCHYCDNPPCCNPEHLFLGTHTDNKHDSVRKSRHFTASGETNGRAKITDAQLEALRARYRQGEDHVTIAEELGMGAPYISLLLRGKKRPNTRKETLNV